MNRFCPERIIEPEGPASEILKLCDGTRSVAATVDELAAAYVVDRAAISQDVTEMLMDRPGKGCWWHEPAGA